MKELLFSMAKGLVDHPDEMEIYEEYKNGVVTLSLRVHPNDMGKVIGKQGRIANSCVRCSRPVPLKKTSKLIWTLIRYERRHRHRAGAENKRASGRSEDPHGGCPQEPLYGGDGGGNLVRKKAYGLPVSRTRDVWLFTV